jgi:hypothetical protein
MATKTWTNGAANGNFNTAGNWAPSGKPVKNDDVFFVASNNSPVTAGLDQSGGAGLHLNLIQTERGFTSKIGVSGSPLIITANRVVHRGEGEFWYKDGTGTELQWTREILIASPTVSGNAAVLDGAAIERVLLRRGRTQIAGSTGPIARLELGFQGNPASDVICDIASGAGAIGRLILNAAQELVTDCAIGFATCRSGEWRHEGGTIGFLINAGALIIFNPDETQGRISTGILMAGTLDTLQTQRKKDIGVLLRMPGATFLRDEGLVVPDETVYIGDLVDN